jgi:prepilin-type processing-associated H-X9-DG protein
MPALRKVKEAAKDISCKSNLRSIGLAVVIYLQDYDRKLPDTRSANSFLWKDAGGNYLTTNNGSAYWGVVYINYLKNTKIFGCPSLRRVPELIYNVDPDAIQEAAFALNHKYTRDRNTTEIRPHSEFIFCHDHVEPRVENDVRDMFHNNDVPGAMNLTHYRQGGDRSIYYRDIFRHNIRAHEDFRTGGRANILWLDGHVTHLEETTGDNVPLKWYTGER